MVKTLILGDIHGRTFWKDAVSSVEEGTPIIFLGDYVDPYSDTRLDGIEVEDAIANFEEIIDFAKEHANVTLLYGNHDCGYAIDRCVCGSRRSIRYYNDISAMFRNNSELFTFAAEVSIDGTRYLITHAGVQSAWLRRHRGLFGTENLLDVTSDIINSAFENDRKGFVRAISEVSYFRGGNYDSGSMIWADINEFKDDEPEGVSDKYIINQIVGHTAQYHMCNDGKYRLGDAVRYGNVVCVDCGKAVYLDENGELRYLENNKII